MLNAPLRLVALATIVLTCTACVRERDRWTGPQDPVPDPPRSATDGATLGDELRAKHIILFAPLDLGPLAEIYPEARLDYPFKMAFRVDLLMRDWDGQVGTELPGSGQPRWDEGRVPATVGASAVVLGQVIGFSAIPGQRGSPGVPDRVEALVELRALDVNGRTVYRKRATGIADVTVSPKLQAASSIPEARATWDALDTALGNLRTFLEARSDLAGDPVRSTAVDPDALPLAQVVFDTVPTGADVLVDGQFRGNTPLTLHLPLRELTLRVEREGYQPWERRVTPREGMIVQPVLDALPQPVVPQPVDLGPVVVPPAPVIPVDPVAPAPVVPADPVAPAPIVPADPAQPAVEGPVG